MATNETSWIRVPAAGFCSLRNIFEQDIHTNWLTLVQPFCLFGVERRLCWVAFEFPETTVDEVHERDSTQRALTTAQTLTASTMKLGPSIINTDNDATSYVVSPTDFGVQLGHLASHY